MSTKEGRLRVKHLEKALDDILSFKQENLARKLISEQAGKRIGMRHPFLTGIPTLGFWPHASKQRAKKEVLRSLAKADPEIRHRLRAVKDMGRREAHERAVYGLGVGDNISKLSQEGTAMQLSKEAQAEQLGKLMVDRVTAEAVLQADRALTKQAAQRHSAGVQSGQRSAETFWDELEKIAQAEADGQSFDDFVEKHPLGPNDLMGSEADAKE